MNRAIIKYLFALLLFGSNGVTARYISRSSYEIVLLRTLIGSVFLLALFFLSGGNITWTRSMHAPLPLTPELLKQNADGTCEVWGTLQPDQDDPHTQYIFQLTAASSQHT